MYKFNNTTLRCTQRKKTARRKIMIMLVSAITTVLITAGITAAYIFTKTESVENVFTPADVSCEVTEVFEDNVKTDVSIKNTGKADAFIRAAIVVNWVKTDENGKVIEVYAKAPVNGTDYIIDWNNTNWLADKNGFYYFTRSVKPNENTDNLITSCKQIGTAPIGYQLSVEITASAIQSSPETVAEEKWGVTVENNQITAVMSEN